MANETQVQIPTCARSTTSNERKSCLCKCDNKQSFLTWSLPPWLEKGIISIVIPSAIWAVTFLLVGHDGLPGGQMFALLVLLFSGIFVGFLLEKTPIPPLLGMLAVGIMLRNVPKINFGKDITEAVSSPLRQISLVVILIRAGLGLDPVTLKKLSSVVIRLAFGPCIVEAVTIGIASHLILGFPWAWGILLGFVIAAVSPAVIVPCLLNLRDRGYGVAKGIPTIVIAAASIDDILAISGFGIAVGFALTKGTESLVMTICKGPMEVAFGILFGVVWGLGMGVCIGRTDKEMTSSTVLRILFSLIGGCMSVFGFQYLEFPGSGALGCLLASFVAAVIWRKKKVLRDNDNTNKAFQQLWFIFQPLLFGLIGVEIDLHSMKTSVIIKGLICLSIAVVVRIFTSFFMVIKAGLTIKERIFIALAWLPKATVQAAIGPMALDLARAQDAGADAERLGMEVLTMAVVSILLTAPIGAIAIMLTGPKLLTKDAPDSTGESLDASEDLKTLKSAASVRNATTKSSDMTSIMENTLGTPNIKINVEMQMVSDIKILDSSNEKIRRHK